MTELEAHARAQRCVDEAGGCWYVIHAHDDKYENSNADYTVIFSEIAASFIARHWIKPEEVVAIYGKNEPDGGLLK